MRITLVPAAYGQTGATTASLLVSMFMAMRYSKEVGFIPVTGKIEETLHYLDLENGQSDISRSISQVHKLMQLGSISNEEIRAYATPTIRHYDMFNLNDRSISEKEVLDIQRHLIATMPYDYVFVDLEYPLHHPSSEACIASSDIVIIITNQNAHVISRIAELRKSEQLKNKHCMVIVNQYNSNIESQQKMLKRPGLPDRETLFLHYNPLIQQFMNNGKVIELLEYINGENIMVAEIEADLCRICDTLTTHSGDMIQGASRRKKIALPTGKRGGLFK